MKKYTYEQVKDIFQKNSWTLLSTEYINSKQRLEVKCNNNHLLHINLNNFLTGYRCTECYGKRYLNFDRVSEDFKKEGHILLSNIYINSSTKLKCICPIGHTYEKSYNSFQKLKTCPICSNKHKRTLEEVKELFQKDNYTLLSKEYNSNKQKLEYICSNGHIKFITLHSYLNGCRCSTCFKLYCKGDKHPNWKHGRKNDCECGNKKAIKAKHCKKCSLKYQIGNNNPNWKNGISFFPYSTEFTKALKLKIRTRDNFICQGCGIKESEYNQKLSVHHINYDKNNCSESNLITTCRKCNSIANGNRDYWFAYYTYLIEDMK